MGKKDNDTDKTKLIIFDGSEDITEVLEPPSIWGDEEVTEKTPIKLDPWWNSVFFSFEAFKRAADASLRRGEFFEFAEEPTRTEQLIERRD